jgi:hypothetical protein
MRVEPVTAGSFCHLVDIWPQGGLTKSDQRKARPNSDRGTTESPQTLSARYRESQDQRVRNRFVASELQQCPQLNFVKLIDSGTYVNHAC